MKSPLAAEIREPGRAYLQVGNNEIFELFQSAYSGAPSAFDDSKNQKAFNICCVEFSGKKHIVYVKKKAKAAKDTTTQLDTIVEYINKYCEENAIEKLPGICLPSLEDVIPYDNKRYIQLRNGEIENLEQLPLLLTIINVEDFWNGNYSKNATEQFKKVVKLGKTMKAAFIICNVENAVIGFSSGEIMKFLKENRNLIFFDNLNNLKLFDVSAAQLRKYKKPIDIGDAYFFKEQEVEKIKTVVTEKGE